MEQQQTQGNEPFAPAPQEEKSWGMVIGGVIVIVALIGVVAFMMNGSSEMAQTAPATQTTTETTDTATEGTPAPAEVTADAAAVALSIQGTSDEIDAITADLNNTNLNSVGELIENVQ